ncbi:hypothetical protein [Psychrobacter pygoscelis]|uniref:hypothetical protein n=1 Tax=Psychrobacter pygoscelis TaxID=2488563 RepID=UPI001F6114C7|nr:hypothetical protein [Psychrobacter pygoscelis]
MTIFLKSDVGDLTLINPHFRRWKLPPNTSRGLCILDYKPNIKIALAGNLILIPTDNYPDVAVLPEPSMHWFYNRRGRDMDLPKYNGSIHNQAVVIKAIANGLYERVAK